MDSIKTKVVKSYRKTVTLGHYAPTARVRKLFLEFEQVYGITAMNFIRRETPKKVGRAYMANKIGVSYRVIAYAQISMGLVPPASSLRPERKDGKLSIATQLKLDGIYTVHMYDMVISRIRKKKLSYKEAVAQAKEAVPRIRKPNRIIKRNQS